MGAKLFFAAIVVALASILAYFMTYIVEEGQQAVITQFGKPVNFVTDPGLKFRIPFIQSVHRLEKRLLPWDGAPENMQTGDKKRIYVDCWARWRIVDLETFFTNVQTEQNGQKILDDIVDSSVRDVIARNNLIDLVRTSKDRELVQENKIDRPNFSRDVVTTGRMQIEEDILADASDSLESRYGMQLVAVHIKRVSYNDRVKDTVFERMRSERQLVAQLFESEAREEGNKISGLTRKELDSIEGEMTQKSAEIRGSADAEVIRLTAEAYGRNVEFFEFLQRLKMYKMALKKDTSLILSTNSDMFRLFKTTDSRYQNNGGVGVASPRGNPESEAALIPESEAVPIPGSEAALIPDSEATSVNEVQGVEEAPPLLPASDPIEVQPVVEATD